MTIRHVFVTRLFQDMSGQVAQAPGTIYVELDQTLRAMIDFSAIRGTRARVVVSAQGNEAGDSKGIEVYLNGVAQVCEVTWNGNALQVCLAGSWTALVGYGTDLTLQVDVKASSATENITVYTVDLEIEYY